jgi:hypothetical protein
LMRWTSLSSRTNPGSASRNRGGDGDGGGSIQRAIAVCIAAPTATCLPLRRFQLRPCPTLSHIAGIQVTRGTTGEVSRLWFHCHRNSARLELR